MLANIASLIFSVLLLVFVIIGKNEGKEIKKEKITYFLQKHEITEIVKLPVRSSKLKKAGGIAEAAKSFQVTAFGNTYIVDLFIFYPREDTEINYASKLLNNSRTYLEDVGGVMALYQGYVRNIKNSSALGQFSQDNRFRGYLITDEILCIEPYYSGSVIVYSFKDVIYPGCRKSSENEVLDCAETQYFAPWAAHREPPKRRLGSPYNLYRDEYLEFLNRLQAIKAKPETNDKQKNPSADKHDDSESKNISKNERKGKNINSIEQKSEFFSAKEDYDIHEEPISGGKTKTSDKRKTVGSTETKKHKSEKHKPKPKKEKIEEDDDDDDDDDIIEEPDYGNNTRNSYLTKTKDSSEKRKHTKHKPQSYERKPTKEEEEDYKENKDKNKKILRDDSRFDVPENNVVFQKHSIDVTHNFSTTSRRIENDSKNVMSNTRNNMDSSNMWKESADVNENYKKGIVKREKESDVESTNVTPVEALQCNVQVIIAPSFLKKFDGDTEMAVKDVYIQFVLLNKIFLKLPLESRGQSIHLTFHATNIVVHGDEVYSPFPGDRAHLDFYTKSTRNPHSLKEICLSIGVVNKFLIAGGFYDGYTPEGNGGACSKSGNTLLVSHGSADTPAPMAIYFAALMRGVTRAIGALDKDKECEEGTYPNPMEVLQEYLLAEKIAPFSGISIFTSCNVKEIEKTINLKACLYRVSQPLCGNAILDPGEECDCGPGVLCSQVDPCCNKPRVYLDPTASEVKKGLAHVSCTLTEGSKCSESQPCCRGCEINKDKSVCYSGPSDCDIALCNGKSAWCPTGVEASNGMICHTNETLSEPMICKDSICNQPLCSSFQLEPCTCAPGSDRDCLYCCMKDGKCQAAGSELKLYPNRNYYLPDGTDCMGGSCMLGKCFIYEVEGARMRMRLRETLDKPPRIPAAADGRNEISPLLIILHSAFFLFVLFLLQN